MGPASMFQVALVPPYEEVKKSCEANTQVDGEAKRYATEVIYRT